MKRIALVLASLLAVTALTACGGPPLPPAPTEPRKSVMIGKLGKTEMFLHTTKIYDPLKVPYTPFNGEPSQVPYFKPVRDEGIRNRDYPVYDPKTFKFLALPTAAIPPQDYYMFVKNGGTLNPALKPLGYKAVDIIDTGHIKILPNLYVGYYDFAWVPFAVMTEYWSGNESMDPELWKRGDGYVIIGNSTDGDSSLMAPNAFTDPTKLAGKKVGIMNVSLNTEALFNKKLNTMGLATSAAGGNVDIEMGTPGFVMNDLVAKKLAAVFSWSVYTKVLQRTMGYHELIPWQDLGYDGKLSNVVLVVRRDILEKHPDVVKKVVELNYAATQRAVKDGDYAEPAAKRYQDWDNAYMGDHMRVSTLGVPNLDADINRVYVSDVYDYMVKCGYFKTQYPLGTLMDLTYEDAVARLNP